MPSSFDTYLMPFDRYPRLVCCDRQKYVYFVRADVQHHQAVRLGRTDNVFTGMVLPDDEGFVLIKQSNHGNQKIERFDLASVGGKPTTHPKACGNLYKDINPNCDGYAVFEFSTGPSLMTLLPTGLLVRKHL